MNTRTLTVGLVLLLGAAGSAWWLLHPTDAPASWRTTTVERKDVKASVSATGSLDAVTTVEVGTQVTGVIAELLVDYNDPVTAGQVVARIDTALLDADVATARASLAVSQAEGRQAQQELARVQRLLDKGAATTAELEDAQTADEVARARVRSSQVALDRATRNRAYATITSPIDGVVIERDVDVGQTVNAGMSAPRLLLVAGDLASMQILASVDEADIGRIHPSQPVDFTVQAWPDDHFEGTVRQVRLQSTVEENVVTYTVVVDVDNHDGRLLPGMTATVDFITEQVPDVLCASTAALRFRPDEDQLDPAALAELQARRAARQGSKGGDAEQSSAEHSHGGAARSRVYTVAPSGKLRPLRVESGVSDGSCTQISGEGVEEGLELVTGVQRGDSKERGSLLSTTGGGSSQQRQRPPGSF